jgi:hypothetical protein
MHVDGPRFDACTGIPDRQQQLASAMDASALAYELLKQPELNPCQLNNLVA